MNKKKIVFWAVVIAVLAGLLCFLKFNPLYATFEIAVAFALGMFGEGIGKWIYDKWVKEDGTIS